MKIATRLIKMKRGELFQLARNMQQLLPADASHAERFRRICSVIREANQKLLKPHEREVVAAREAIPEKDRSQEAMDAAAMEIASKLVEIRVDAHDLKVLTKAYMTQYTSPLLDAQGHPVGGQAYRNLQLMHEDLVALGVWDAYGIADRLIAAGNMEALDAEFPSDKLELDDETLDDEFKDPQAATEA